MKPTGKQWAVLPATSVIGVVAALGAASGAELSAVTRAVDRGVAFVKGRQHAESGTWTFRAGPEDAPATTGATALAALTLLECGVSAKDPSVQKAAEAVRHAVPDLGHTYSISLAILLLDRLGDPGDVGLIHALALRLLGGQNASGGWSYDCPLLDREPGRRELARQAPPAGGPTEERQSRDLPPEVRGQLETINPAEVPDRGSDNSNTKFATLALWVARRHGMPVGQALRLVENRFRKSQNEDGGWGYLTPGGSGPMGRRGFGLSESMGTMTCAGLLGLAVGSAYQSVLRTDAGDGSARPSEALPRPAATDPAVRSGLIYIGMFLRRPLSPAAPALHGPKYGDEYYFLWALERVAVAYDLKAIGGRDWYSWGAEYLLAHQRSDGAWQRHAAQHGVDDKAFPVVDTCFALLFLRQANLTTDLTRTLRGQLEDPARERGVPENRSAAPAAPVTPSAPVRPAPQRTEQPTPAGPAPSSPSATVNPAPTAKVPESRELVARLLAVPASEQSDLFRQFGEAKGSAYTQALAESIPRLSGTSKAEARQALAGRMARMTSETLTARLRDPLAEVRRAAALACAMKEDKAHVPDLIRLLDDPEPAVPPAARAALKSLTGQDLGPTAETWRRWWSEHGK